MKKALFMIHNRSTITEMLPLATRLQETGRYQVLFHINRYKKQLEDGLAECDTAGVPCILGQQACQVLAQRAGADRNAGENVASETGEHQTGSEAQRRVLDRLLPLLLPSLLRSMHGVGQVMRFYRKEIAVAKSILGEERPGILVFSEEPLWGLETALSRAAHARGISSLVIPFQESSMGSQIGHTLLHPHFEHRRTSKSRFNRVVARLFPRSTISYREERLFHPSYPSEKLLAAKLLGVASPNNGWWQTGPDSICMVAAEGLLRAEKYLRQGLPKEQIVVTGKPLHDVLFKVAAQSEARRAVLYERLGLPQGRRMILCAVPQLAEHGVFTWDEERSAIEVLMAGLTSVKDTNVVLSLHPTVQRERYTYLENKFGVRIGDESSTYLIPLCDLLVSCGSSIITMAICCQRPVINLDFWVPDGIYTGVDGVITVDDETQLEPTLQRVMGDPDEYARLKAALAKEWPRRGVVDGRAIERLVSLVDKLAGYT